MHVCPRQLNLPDDYNWQTLLHSPQVTASPSGEHLWSNTEEGREVRLLQKEFSPWSRVRQLQVTINTQVGKAGIINVHCASEAGQDELN